MENDETTPACKICGDEHIGLLTPAYALLRGSYMIPPSLGHEVFVLDPELGAEFFKLPNGQHAIILDVNKRKPASCIAHEVCVRLAIEALDTVGPAGVEDYVDEDDDENDDDDYQRSWR
jgi:hypothetical protein